MLEDQTVCMNLLTKLNDASIEQMLKERCQLQDRTKIITYTEEILEAIKRFSNELSNLYQFLIYFNASFGFD